MDGNVAGGSNMFDSSAKNVYNSGNFFGNKNTSQVRTCPMFPGATSASTTVCYSAVQGYDYASSHSTPGPISDFKMSNCNHSASYALMMDGWMPPLPAAQVSTLVVHSMVDIQGPTKNSLHSNVNNGAIDTYLYGYANILFMDGHCTQDNTLAKITANVPLNPTYGNQSGKPWFYLKYPF